MDIAPIGSQVDDGVAHDLAWAVVGDAAAATGFVDVDASGGERLGRRQDVRAPAVAPNTERKHVRVFDQKEQIADRTGAAVVDERAL
jgi:hypothetical protein